MRKRLIVNADDLGLAEAVNAGIARAHRDGVVTSASLMVDAPAAVAGAAIARAQPALSVGLHFVGDGRHARPLDLSDPAAVRAELARQLGRFAELVGAAPTHLDAHHHVHHEQPDVFREAAAALGVPLRGEPGVTYVGGFYAQWEWGVTDLHHVSVEFLEWILREEVGPGFTELGCHPAHAEPPFASAYASERAAELATLVDPRIRATLDRLGIELASYRDCTPST